MCDVPGVMGAKAVIIDADRGTVLGHIAADAVIFEGGRGTILGDAGSKVEELVGRGHAQRRFHLLLPASRLDGCRIVAPRVVFTYETMNLLDDDEAPPTYPEHVLDEETPSEDGIWRSDRI